VIDLRWTLIPAALLLCAALAELLARWWIRRRTGYYVFPPGRRMLLHPNSRVFPQLEPSIRFDVNREGERGDEVPRLGPGEKLFRILVVGGSQPEGYLLDQDTSWPGALHRLLERPDSLRRLEAARVHVGSIARSGVGSEALGVILDRVLPRYDRLQAIVVLVGASDVLRWLEQGAPPSPPSPASTSDVFTCHPESAFGWKPRSLALVELVLRARYRWLRPVEVHERAGSWVGKARAMRAQASVVRTTLPDPDPMLDHFERHFGQVLRKARAHADRVLVVRQPWFDRDCTPEEASQMWHGGAGQAWREEVTTYYSHDVLRQLMALLDGRAARLAQALDVEQLDLRPRVPPSQETYYDFFHLTPAGARAVAAAVEAMLLAPPSAVDGQDEVAGALEAGPVVERAS
jgi:lysophospholipase L1-like esterase